VVVAEERGWRKGRRVVSRPLRGTLRRRGKLDDDADDDDGLVASAALSFEFEFESAGEGLYWRISRRRALTMARS